MENRHFWFSKPGSLYCCARSEKPVFLIHIPLSPAGDKKIAVFVFILILVSWLKQIDIPVYMQLSVH